MWPDFTELFDLSLFLFPQCDTLCALALGAKAIEDRHLVARQELHTDAAECTGGAAQVSRPTFPYPITDLLYIPYHSTDCSPIYRAPRVLLHLTWALFQLLPSCKRCSKARTTSHPVAAAKQRGSTWSGLLLPDKQSSEAIAIRVALKSIQSVVSSL